MYKRILIPAGASECSELAVHEGLCLTKAFHAFMVFLKAVEDSISLIYVPRVTLYEMHFYDSAKQSGKALAVAIVATEDAGVLTAL